MSEILSKLKSFNGGVHLTGHKELSSNAPLIDAQLPKLLVYPLQIRPGVETKPVVAVGDKVLRGQVLADADHPLATPIHAGSSGIITAIEKRAIAHPSGLPALCIVMETDGLDQAVAAEPIADYTKLDAQSLREKIRQAGIVGLGGAVFPTSIKLNPRPTQTIDTLILNGAECEPYISCDDKLMQSDADQVIKGAQILLHILQIERCIIAIEEDMPDAIAGINAELAAHCDERISVAAIPAVYPTGGEKQLIRVVTGRETPAGGIPADIGIVCQNVGTAAAVYQAVCQGVPLTERIITVTGKGINKAQNMRVRVGTLIKDLTEQCQGYTAKAERLIMGGPMMGFALPEDNIPVVKGTNCILVTDEDSHSHEPTRACIRCGECAKACPMTLLPQQLYWFSRSDKLDQCSEYNVFDCIECGCCDVVCPSHIPLVQYFRSAKDKIKQKAREAEKAALAKKRHDALLARKEQQAREKAERVAQKKAALAKAKAAEAEAAKQEQA